MDRQKTRFKDLWRTNCQCLIEYDCIVADKDAEIAQLKCQLTARSDTVELPVSEQESHEPLSVGSIRPRVRMGKASPVDPFMGEEPEMSFDDWLPSLE